MYILQLISIMTMSHQMKYCTLDSMNRLYDLFLVQTFRYYKLHIHLYLIWAFYLNITFCIFIIYVQST